MPYTFSSYPFTTLPSPLKDVIDELFMMALSVSDVLQLVYMCVVCNGNC